MVNMWNRISGELFPNQVCNLLFLYLIYISLPFKAKRMACQLPVHTIAIAAGNIQSLDQVRELKFYCR